ncbi:MAG: MFS transporter [Flavisolibacter sp.]|jgi:fucose permease|nr:MFS transporter [Flavisolibacter sp.]
MDETFNADRKKARIVTSSFFILAGILSATWSSRIPDVQQSFGLNDQLWGTVLFSLPAGLITGLALASWLSSRFGTAIIMIGGCIISSIILAVTGYLSSIFFLVIFLFLIGFTRTIFNIAVNTDAVIVQKMYDKPIISMFHGLWSLACFFAAGISTIMIINGIAPALHFTIVAMACISIVFILKYKIKTNEKISSEKKPFFVKPDKYLLVLGIIAFCTMLCESTMFDWSVNYFDRIVKADKGLITMGYTSFIITMALGRLIGDRFVRRFGARRLIIINGFIIVTGLLIAVIFPFLIPAAFGFLLVGLGDSIIIPVIYSLSAKTKTMPPSYAITSVTMIGYAGFLLGPVIIGTVSEAWGMQWAFVIVALICLGIAGFGFYLKKFEKNDL